MTDGGDDLTSEFNERYRLVGEPSMRRAEIHAIGSDYSQLRVPRQTEWPGEVRTLVALLTAGRDPQ